MPTSNHVTIRRLLRTKTVRLGIALSLLLTVMLTVAMARTTHDFLSTLCVAAPLAVILPLCVLAVATCRILIADIWPLVNKVRSFLDLQRAPYEISNHAPYPTLKQATDNASGISKEETPTDARTLARIVSRQQQQGPLLVVGNGAINTLADEIWRTTRRPFEVMDVSSVTQPLYDISRFATIVIWIEDHRLTLPRIIPFAWCRPGTSIYVKTAATQQGSTLRSLTWGTAVNFVAVNDILGIVDVAIVRGLTELHREEPITHGSVRNA